MKIVDIIEDKINRLPTNYVFTYSDFNKEVEAKNSIIKILNKLVTTKKIAKLSKGKFYKPQKTPFGLLKPPAYQIVKDFIEQNGKLIGYLTGYSVYNDLGLTTQISNQIQIGTNKYRHAVKRENYTISFIVQPNKITKDNIVSLRILDAVRFIKAIPATTPDEACIRLKEIFRELTPEKQQTLVNLALKYTDSVRALCGAILEDINADEVVTAKLKNSLNNITDYKIPISETVLPAKTKWRIK
ncbi:MAG: DUF6088 family protein [Planctomycetaceae bacterium]|jgi:hypothetical protein|nr:DUF6088 family protein [Planctomycetaceae bacterium]